MKKIDKLVLKSFFGPFILTFAVVEFILLCITLIKYFEDIVGKDLGAIVYFKLVFYFLVNIVPVSLPLGILLSSIMTFGNLGEHKELTALKSAGISLIRLLRPVFVFVIAATIGLFVFTEYAVTWANLNVYSLLYDVRQMKPTLEFKEKIYYYGIPNYVIKVNEKFEDGQTLKGIQIYDHSKRQGNTDVIVADSGKMYMINNNNYLVLELFNGNSYSQYTQGEPKDNHRFFRSSFKASKIVFSMETFGLDNTDKDLFKGHKMMMRMDDLLVIGDSTKTIQDKVYEESVDRAKGLFKYLNAVDTLPIRTKMNDVKEEYTEFKKSYMVPSTVSSALQNARNIKGTTSSYAFRITHHRKDSNNYFIEFHKRFTQPFSCLILFLIGAPLGAIIKKGGLGVPVLISIVFFIIMYITSELGWKWARDGFFEIMPGVWFSNFLMIPIGLYFLNQARSDSNILEFEHWKSFFTKFKKKPKNGSL